VLENGEVKLLQFLGKSHHQYDAGAFEQWGKMIKHRREVKRTVEKMPSQDRNRTKIRKLNIYIEELTDWILHLEKRVTLQFIEYDYNLMEYRDGNGYVWILGLLFLGVIN